MAVKKSLLFASIAIIAATAGVGAFFYLKGWPGRGGNPAEAAKVIPDQAVMATFISVNPKALTPLQKFGTPELEKLLGSGLQQLQQQSVGEGGVDFTKDLNWVGGIMLAVVPPQEKTPLAAPNLLVVVGIRDKLGAWNFANKMKNQSANAKKEDTNYKGVTISEITEQSGNSETPGQSGKRFSIALLNDYLVLSPERKLVESAIDTTQGGKSFASQEGAVSSLVKSANIQNPIATLVIPNYAAAMQHLLNQPPMPPLSPRSQLQPQAPLPPNSPPKPNPPLPPNSSSKPNPPLPPNAPPAPNLPTPPNAPPAPNAPLPPQMLERLKQVQSMVIGLGADDHGLRLKAVAKIDPQAVNVADQQPNPGQTLNKFPAETIALITAKGISQSWSTAVTQSQNDPSIKQGLDAVRQGLKSFNLDADRDVFSWMNGEFAIGLIASNQGNLAPIGFGGALIFETKNRNAAEATLKKLEGLAKGSQLRVNKRNINGTPVTEWQIPSQGTLVGYGWHSPNSVFVAFGDPIVNLMAAPPSKPLKSSANFTAITGSLPQQNLGYFYLDMDQAMVLLNRFLAAAPQNQFPPETAAVLNSIQGLGVTATWPDQSTSQLEMLLALKPKK